MTRQDRRPARADPTAAAPRPPRDELDRLRRRRAPRPARRARRAPARRRRHGARAAARGPTAVTVVRRRRAPPRLRRTSTRASGSACCRSTQVPDYRLEVAYGGPATRRRRPVPVPADARRDRPAPDRRGPARAALGRARRARAHATTAPPAPVHRHVVRGLGAERPRRPGRRRLQLLGRPRRTRCARSARRGVWELFVPGVGDGTHYKFEILGADGVVAAEGRPDGLRAPRCRRRPRRWCTSSPYEWGDDEWMAARAARPAARGADEHLRGAPRLVAAGPVATASWPTSWSSYVTDLGLHPRRAPAGGRAPVRRLLGLPGHRRTTRRPSRFGTPDDFRYLVDRLHQAGIGVIVDWVPAHFPKDAWALARFDGTPLYEHADPRRGEQPDWGTLRLRLRPARGAQLPRRQRAVLAARSSTSTGCGSTPSPRCSTSTTRARTASGLPNEYGGRENLEAVAFLQEINATVYKRVPGRRHDRRGVDRLAGRHPADPPRRARLRPQVEHGLDARLAGLHRASEPIYRQYHHHQMTFSLMYAYTENFVLPISHDEVVHGKGSLLRKMPGDRWQQLANLRALPRLHVGAPGQAAALHGLRVRPGGGVGRGRARWTGGCSRTPTTAACSGWSRDLNRVYRDTPALWSQDTDPAGFELDRRQRRRQQRVLVPALRRRRRGRSPASPTSPACRTRATGSACRTPAAGTRSSTPTPSSTAARGVGNLGGGRGRRRAAGTGSRPRRRCGSRRWARVWLRRTT